MALPRLLQVILIVLLLAMVSASVERPGRKPGQKQKGANAKAKSFRLRRNPHFSRHSRSLSSSGHDEEAWGSEVSDARELNIFLRNAASLIYDDNVMSMSMPTMAPALVRPAIGGTDNSNFGTPKPIPLPTQPPVCAPLTRVPNSDDIALNVFITYELTIWNNASLSEVLKGLDASYQEAVASSLAGCDKDNSRRIIALNDIPSHHHGRSLVMTAVDSLGVVETPRPGKDCAALECFDCNASVR